MTTTADQIFRLTLEIHRVVRHRFMRSGESPFEMNPLQLFALFAIHDQEGIRMRELANVLRITSPSATSFADRLVKYGWITRRKDSKNRKTVLLFTTKKGKEVLQDHLRKKSSLMGSILGVIPDADQKELLRILNSLYHHLNLPS